MPQHDIDNDGDHIEWFKRITQVEERLPVGTRVIAIGLELDNQEKVWFCTLYDEIQNDIIYVKE